jgi:hypothetical protein
MPTPTPRSVGLDGGWISPARSGQSAGAFFGDMVIETVEDLQKAVGDFERSESWSRLQPVAFRLLGQYSFGLGVVYGIGENVVTSVVDLLVLVKTFLLADLYDRAQQPVFSAASLNPVALVQRLMAEVSMRTFRAQLEDAHRERQAMVEELRYAMTHISEVLGGIKDSYVAKWNRFEALVQDRTLSSQFQAGRIFGEVLIEVVSVIAGGTAAVRAVGKIPRLAKLARLKIPAKSTGRALGAAEGVAARQAPVTPSQARPAAPEPPVQGKQPRPLKPPKVLTKDELADWYRKQGARFEDHDTLESHLAGTDFSNPVLLREVPEGTEVVQYVRVDGKPGMYFARPGTRMDQLGIREPPSRVAQRFILKEPLEAVESTAATLKKDLAPGVGGPGGGQQLILPRGWESSVTQVR